MLHTPTSSRRQFLLTGSAVAAAVMLAGDMVAESTGLQLLADAPGPRIPVGYVEGSAGATSLAAALQGGASRAVPAADLRGGAELSGAGALLTMQGFAGTATPSAYRHVLVDTIVPSPARRNETIPFFAFTYRGQGSAQSAPAKLRVAAGSGLRAGVRLESAAESAASSSATTVFSSRAGRGLPVLQPGVYLLGMQPGSWARATQLPAADSSEWAALHSVVLVVEAVPG
jgi:hypothetical protein